MTEPTVRYRGHSTKNDPPVFGRADTPEGRTNKRRRKHMSFKKVFGAGVLSVGLVAGLAGFAGATSGTIGTTGADSNNQVTSVDKSKVDVDNDNNVNLHNRNEQKASSGKAEAQYNTTAGSAMSGDVANTNSLGASVSVTNSMPETGAASVAQSSGSASGSATITNTGYDSNNQVKSETSSVVKVSNDNNVHVSNSSQQSAWSGSAEVSRNTTGGNAVSGDATNNNSSNFTVTISN